MKRLLAAILLLYLTTPLFSSGMEIVHSVSYPMQLRLEWTAVGDLTTTMSTSTVFRWPVFVTVIRL